MPHDFGHVRVDLPNFVLPVKGAALCDSKFSLLSFDIFVKRFHGVVND